MSSVNADNQSIRQVQNQAHVDVQLNNLGISGYQHLVDYLASAYPKTLSTNGLGIGEKMEVSKTCSQLYTSMMLSFTHTHLKHDDLAKNVFGDNFPLSSAAMASLRGQMRLGYPLYPSSQSAVIPFLQYGYENWQLDTGGLPFTLDKPIPINGYSQAITAKVASLGFIAQWAVVSDWVLSTNFSLGHAMTRPHLQFNGYINNRPFNQRDVYYQDSLLSSSNVIEMGISSDYAFTPLLHGRLGINYLNILWGNGQAYAVGVSDISQYVPKQRFSQWTLSTGIGYTLDNPSQGAGKNDDELINSIASANNQAFASLGYSYTSYVEFFNRELSDRRLNSEIIRDKELAIGITKTWHNWYSQFTLAASKGRSNYTGLTQLAGVFGDSLKDITSNNMVDVGGRLGYQFDLTSKLALTPYGNLQYHHWFRNLPPVHSSYGFLVNPITENYQHYYYGMGLLGQWNVMSRLVLGAEGNYGSVYKPEMSSWNNVAIDDFTRTISYFTVYDMQSKPYYELGLSMDFLLGKDWHLLAKVSETHFSYGRSIESAFHSYEPDSDTCIINSSIGIGYSFS
ncbi:MAG: autotransporter domain-containing protein [bacterium]|nr:autotransporter domain-containing protein [bacterium]